MTERTKESEWVPLPVKIYAMNLPPLELALYVLVLGCESLGGYPDVQELARRCRTRAGKVELAINHLVVVGLLNTYDYDQIMRPEPREKKAKKPSQSDGGREKATPQVSSHGKRGRGRPRKIRLDDPDAALVEGDYHGPAGDAGDRASSE